MSDSRAFAALSSGLLARKGAAKPAMRPQSFAPLVAVAEDLGWNDMGAARPPAPRPMVLEHQRRLEQVFHQPTPPVQPAATRPVPAKSGKARTAFTVRVDPERHLKLRLASAVTNRSAQQLLTEALDLMLESVPLAEKLAEHVAASEASERQG